MCIINSGDEVIRSLGPTLAIDPRIELLPKLYISSDLFLQIAMSFVAHHICLLSLCTMNEIEG
jgi:hypothetical protein